MDTLSLKYRIKDLVTNLVWFVVGMVLFPIYAVGEYYLPGEMVRFWQKRPKWLQWLQFWLLLTVVVLALLPVYLVAIIFMKQDKYTPEKI